MGQNQCTCLEDREDNMDEHDYEEFRQHMFQQQQQHQQGSHFYKKSNSNFTYSQKPLVQEKEKDSGNKMTKQVSFMHMPPAQKGPELEIKVVSSKYNSLQGAKFLITPNGVLNSLREEQDGKVYFGSSKNQFNDESYQFRSAVDIEVQPEADSEQKLSFDNSSKSIIEGVKTKTTEDYSQFTNQTKKNSFNRSRSQMYFGRQQQQKQRFFVIKFDSKEKKYLMKDIGSSLGLFIKVDHSITVKNTMLLQCGTSYILMNMSYDSQDEKHPQSVTGKKQEFNYALRQMKSTGSYNQRHPNLCLSLYSKESQAKPKTTIIYWTTLGVRIGRDQGNEIPVDDQMVSKVQCNLQYLPQQGWVLFDGYKDKSSTNGTWVYQPGDIAINSGLVFKCKNTVYKCALK